VFTLTYQLPKQIICNAHKIFELNKIESVIYNRDFKEFLSESDFLDFIRVGSKKAITSASEILAQQNTQFDKLYYFAIIPKYEKVILKSDKTVFSYLKEGSWIGIVEFILNCLNNKDSKWLINLACESSSDVIIVYEFDKNLLKQFFNSGNENLVNGLLFIWIKYLIISVTKMNLHLAKAYKSLENVPTSRFNKAVPEREFNNHITIVNKSPSNFEIYKEEWDNIQRSNNNASENNNNRNNKINNYNDNDCDEEYIMKTNLNKDFLEEAKEPLIDN